MVGKPNPRPIFSCECGDHAFVELTRGYVALCCKEAVSAISVLRWTAYPDRNTVYAKAAQISNGRKRTITMHGLVLPGDGHIDHIDGNGLDNRRHNLRRCTNQQNQWNSRYVCGASRFKGVRPMRSGWSVRIRINGHQKSIGVYKTEEEAARAYDRAAIANFGEFAQTNETLGLLARAALGEEIVEDKEMAQVASEYGLDPIGDFEQERNK